MTDHRGLTPQSIARASPGTGVEALSPPDPKPALLLNEEEFWKLLGFSLQDFDPLFQFGNQIVKLHGSWNTEVKICKTEYD